MPPGEAGPAGKAPLAVVVGITPDYAFAAAVVLMGLRRFPPAPSFDVVVFHSGLDEPARVLLSAILPCRFESYRLPEATRERIPPSVLGAFSEVTFSRYECFGLLARYARVVWLDVDIVIRGDTSALPGRCRGGIGMARERKRLGVNFHGPVAGVDMEADFFNSGVIVFSDALPGWRAAGAWCYGATLAHAPLLRMADQAVLNLWLAAHGIVPDDILPEFNRFGHERDDGSARIVHAVGHRKPWTDFADPGWNAGYERWLAMGGVPCPTWRTLRLIAARQPRKRPEPARLAVAAAAGLRFLLRHGLLLSRSRKG